MNARDASGDRFSPAVLKRRAQGGGWVLLGPGLSLFALDRLPASPAALSPADREAFRELGLIVPGSPPGPRSLQERRKRAALPGFTGVIAAHPSPRGRAAAALLSRALEEQGGSFTSRGAASLRTIAPDSVVLWMGQTEPTSPLRRIGPLLRRGLRVLWFGETSAGLQVGPLFKTTADVQDYTEATSQWGQVKELRRLGFRAEWPLSLIDRTLADPRRIARTIRRVLAEPRACVLLPSNRRVALWTEVRARPLPFADLRESQRWPKGLFSALKVERLPGGGFLASCAPPCRGIAFLEGCNGKGLDRHRALVTAMGEAIERFAASEAGLSLIASLPEPSDYPLSDFHPREDRRYEAYLQSGSPHLPGYPALDELSGRPSRVPECLVPFPYLPPPNRPAFASDTAGLAAYPDRDGAILRGASEILERHNFYPHFLHQRPALNLAEDGTALGPRIAQMIAGLERSLPARVWLLEYPEAHRLPIVHAFLLDRRACHMSRGTGAGLTVASAAERALLEALMSRVQHEHLRRHPELRGQGGFRDWAHPTHVRDLTAYLDRHPKAASTARPAADEPALFDRLKGFLRAEKVPLLVAELPCPVEGWSAVRVLLPGFTCHGHASRSLGGRALLGAALRLRVPT